MVISPDFTAIAMIAAALLLSAWVTQLTIGYARRAGILDTPDRRRSHDVATPRGGGIGLVLATLVTVPVCLSVLPRAWSPWVIIGLVIALIAVALSGWLDDRHSLPVPHRFVVQLFATGLFAGVLLYDHSRWWWPGLVLVGSWSINLHNFMDGIDGLLAQQGFFVSSGLAVMAGLTDQTALCAACACTAAACLGFWYYNWSPARIFMGDVGSGSLGLLLFVWVAMLWRVEAGLLWPALILASAFVADASATLLFRIWRGRCWYSAHREHLYQWMVRRGYSHTTTVLCYISWNSFVAWPLAALALFFPSSALPLCMVTYLFAIAIWLVWKRRMGQRYRLRIFHDNP